MSHFRLLEQIDSVGSISGQEYVIYFRYDVLIQLEIP